MAAYATQKREPWARGRSSSSNRLDVTLNKAISGQTSSLPRAAADAVLAESSILDQLLDHIADRLPRSSPSGWRYRTITLTSGSTRGMPPNTSACIATRFASWQPSERFPPSRTVLAASSTSAARIWTRGEAAADGLAISHQRWQR